MPINWKLHGLARYFSTPLLQSTPFLSFRGETRMSFLWIRRNQNSPRIWPNLGQLKPCRNFRTFRIRYSKNRAFLPTDQTCPHEFSSLLYRPLRGIHAILRFLCRSLSLQSSPPPSSQFPNSACLLVHFMNFLLTNDTRKPNTPSYLSITFLLYPANRLQKCKEFITLFGQILGINKSDRFLNLIAKKKLSFLERDQ